MWHTCRHLCTQQQGHQKHMVTIRAKVTAKPAEAQNTQILMSQFPSLHSSKMGMKQSESDVQLSVKMIHFLSWENVVL